MDWASKKDHIKNMGVVEMRMLRWMYENTLMIELRMKIFRGLRILRIK